MAEHTLILLRHAKSDWSGDESDEHRPLAKRGHRQAPEAGRGWPANIDRIDLAVVVAGRPGAAAPGSSPPPSSRSLRPRRVVDDRVYAASSGELLDVVQRARRRAPHRRPGRPQPGLEDFVDRLTGAWVEMVTSALAVVDLPGGWAGRTRRGTGGHAARPPADPASPDPG